MTETGMVTMNREEALQARRLRTILDDCGVEIHDDEDHALPPGRSARSSPAPASRTS